MADGFSVDAALRADYARDGVVVIRGAFRDWIETLRAGSDLFLVCQKEEHVWRAYEAVYKYAEADRAFRRLVTEKVKRIETFKSKSAQIRARFSPKPDSAAVARLRRHVWEFTEELRAYSLSQSETIAS